MDKEKREDLLLDCGLTATKATDESIIVFDCSSCPAADWEFFYCNIANYKKENPECGLVIINSTHIPENCPLKRKRTILMLGDYLETGKI